MKNKCETVYFVTSQIFPQAVRALSSEYLRFSYFTIIPKLSYTTFCDYPGHRTCLNE